MKTIDDRDLQKTTKEKETKTERSKGNRTYSKRVRAKLFCCAFKLGFLQLIYKASLIFKSNLELALSVRRVSKRVTLLMKLNMMNCILLILLFFLLSDFFSFIIYIRRQANKISRSKKILQVHISYKCIILLPKRS